MNEKLPKSEVGNELSDLEDTVKGALSELTDLENNLLDIIAPSGRVRTDGNYLMVIRRFQNAMKVALLDGISKKDLDIFEEAFNFYNSSIDLSAATGNIDEVEQVKSEFLQQLIKIFEETNTINDPSFYPFVFRISKCIAEIYDSFNQYSTGIDFHSRAGNLQENPLIAHIEYFQVVLDYILLNDIQQAKEYYNMMSLKNFKVMSTDITNATTEKNSENIDKVKKKMEVLGAQRSLNVKNVVLLIDKIKEVILRVDQPTDVETILVPEQSIPLTNEKVEAIQESLAKGIQRIQAAHPNIQVPLAPQIDTNEIVSELKVAISQEISKEIKNLSKDIVSKILSNLPTGVTSAAPLRSAGQISDIGTPSIDIVEGGPRERPKRPKLDDMLDSIIVSE